MKISRKLSVWTLASLFAIGIVAMAVHYVILTEEADKELRTLADAVVPVIEEGLSNSMLRRDTEVLNRTILNTEGIKPIKRILLLDAKGMIKAGTDVAMIGTGLFRVGEGRPVLPMERATIVLPDGERMFRLMRPVRNKPECHECHDAGRTTNGYIVVDFSRAEIERHTKRHLRKEFILFSGPFFLVGTILFLLSNVIVISRLNSFVDAVQRFKSGDSSARISVRGNDEIAKLGAEFNEMADAMTGSQRELKKYADELLALAVSTNVVTAVPRTENLYEAICHIAIRELKLNMAWIGLLKTGSYDVHPVAQCGSEEGYLSSVRITWDDSPFGKGPAGMAIRTKNPQMMNDLENDPAFALWRHEAAKRGYRSLMALPFLSSEGEVLGVLSLYSSEVEYFSRKRLRMFMIFANQAAAAIENRSLLENVEKSSAELREQFKAISQSQTEWQLTFDSITDMVSIHDQEFTIIKANKAVSDYLGLPLDEILYKRCYDLFHGTSSPIANCPHRISLQEKRVTTEEVHDPRTNKLFRVSTFPYHNPEGEFIGTVHIAKDISEEKDTELRLIMTERLASLGQMASGLAHEINTPLASIAGCAEGLLMKIKNNRYDPDLFTEYLQIVEEEIQRCKGITTGMLSFVRTSSYEKKDIHVNEALDKALEIISFQGRLRDVAVLRNYYPELPTLHGSDGELRQVFLIIMTNALDAMENSGTLTFETGVDRENIFIRIADSGPGIAQEHISRIFDPFFTTKSDKGGTGLGLSIAYKIITNHNGTLDIASQEGKGATFTITLPISS